MMHFIFLFKCWPILKNNKSIYFIVSTETVGKGYMSWNEIIKISKEDFVTIGNHSHSHEYLTKYKFNNFKKDIDESIRILRKIEL